MDHSLTKVSAGFTMTELVITMSIVAILMAIGVPSFKYVTTSNRLSTEVNGLLGDLQFARSEAIKNGLPVTVCSSMDGANCNGVNNADDPNDWQGGWIVFLNPTSAQNPPNAGSVIRVQAPFSSLDTFVPFNANFGAITFNREGYAATQNAQTVTLQLHDSTKNPAWTRCLAITTVGMLTTQRVGAAAPACT